MNPTIGTMSMRTPMSVLSTAMFESDFVPTVHNNYYYSIGI